MRKATKAQWIKFAIVLVLYLAFLIWVKSWLGLIVVPFIFDVYISKIIPWTFWKEIKNNTVRTIMSWVDAIVFALVAVYFVNLYLFQNYQIPSSSLEKTLLVGDFLYVSKVSYGPRVPNTPLSMPLTQHTLPIVNTKSYLEWPHWDYKRVAGLGQVERNDIVVFNFPAGDTVVTQYPMDFYTNLVYTLGKQLYPKQVAMDSLQMVQQQAIYNLYYTKGREFINQHPNEFGEVIVRPVDRRENYVKRCVALPGDNFEIKDRIIYIDGKAQPTPKHVQYLYRIKTTGVAIPLEYFHDELGISLDDLAGYSPRATDLVLQLTQEMKEKMLSRKDLFVSVEPYQMTPRNDMYPQNLYNRWTVDNYGPVWVPKKGEKIGLTLENLPIYRRCIEAYENNTVRTEGEKIFINGQEASEYTFQMDYYWMMGDNRHNSQDSRYWGFVPEDHIVGKPLLIWLSLDKDRGWFDGRIRWNRLFKTVTKE